MMISCIEIDPFLYRKKPQSRGEPGNTGGNTYTDCTSVPRYCTKSHILCVPPGQPGHTRYCTGILCVPAPPGVLRREKDSGILVPYQFSYYINNRQPNGSLSNVLSKLN